MGPEIGEYVVAETTKTSEDGMVMKPGTINGGFYQKTENPLSHDPSVVIAVPDIKATMKAVEKNGGQILGSMTANGEKSIEPDMIPGVGLWISIKDTEDNRVSLL